MKPKCGVRCRLVAINQLSCSAYLLSCLSNLNCFVLYITHKCGSDDAQQLVELCHLLFTLRGGGIKPMWLCFFTLNLYLVFTGVALICNPLWWACCWNNPNLLPILYPVGKVEAVTWLMAKTVRYSKAGTSVDFDEALIWWQTWIKINKFSKNLELDRSNIILRKIHQDCLCASWERLSWLLFQ